VDQAAQNVDSLDTADTASRIAAQRDGVCCRDRNLEIDGPMAVFLWGSGAAKAGVSLKRAGVSVINNSPLSGGCCATWQVIDGRASEKQP
jgi:hypothetical protein